MEYTEQKRERFERKFVVDTVSRAEVEQIIKMHPAAFYEIFHMRFNNNMYLDTGSYTYYLDNVVGSSNRIKVRIRWYGDLFGMVSKPVLEYKIKFGNVGRKLSYPLEPFILDEKFDIDYLQNIFDRSTLPHNVQIELKSLKPALVNRYSRKYFRSSVNQFRITIDNDLSYYKVQNRNNLFHWKHCDNDSVIVELKYDISEDNMADNITRYFPFRLTKSSKYVNGVHHFMREIPV